MDNPKTLVALFGLLCAILYGALSVFDYSSGNTFEARVVSQTLTQSLDGHRRYLNVEQLNVEQDGKELLLVQAPPQQDCPEGSRVTIEEQRTSFSNKVLYKVVSCSQP